MYWNSLNDRLREQYGTKVYKLALSSGCSCPNRDGTLGERGCLFCDGAGAFAASGDIPEQLGAAKARAVKDLRARGLTVVVHQILGLPGETPEMMTKTAQYIGNSGANGVKFHLLHVLRNTELAREWEAGRVETMTLEAYIRVLEECVRHIPREVVIHRLTGDGAKRDLLAPLWSGDKKRVLNAIHHAFLRDDVEQGSALESKKP